MTIVLFLAVQTGGGIWWMSRIDTTLSTIQEDVSNQAAEDLRQWARINQNERAVADVVALEAAISARLTAIDSNVERLNGDVRINNSLLRELLRDQRGD